MDEERPKEKEFKIKIEVDPAAENGVYSNLVIVNHSESDFTIDFVYIQPAMKASVRSRVIMSPRNVKKFMLLLARNVEAYEKRFGQLDIGPIPGDPSAVN